MKIFTDISYNKYGQLLDVYIPESNAQAVFVYFHGGGLESGSKSKTPFTDYLLKHNIAVVNAEYRMYPTAKYPDFIEDTADAVAWTFEHIKEYTHTDKIFVGGSSAGGYLSMMLCFDKKYLGKHGIKPTDVTGYIHNAGQPTAHFKVLKNKGFDKNRVIVDETAPLYYVGADGNDCSPMLFLVADKDMENRFEQTQLMLSTLKHFGYDISKIDHKILKGTHCSYDNAIDENGDNVFGKLIFYFIKKHI